MKKVLSSILAGTMLISSIGVLSAFADEPETISLAVVENVDHTSFAFVKDAGNYVTEKWEYILPATIASVGVPALCYSALACLSRAIVRVMYATASGRSIM